ncbi:MAG TPA: S8 family peptidase [Longimicrobiaceae bacterium]|nr:S8 family peptidase [Longimicrobiaceae bacterium]
MRRAPLFAILALALGACARPANLPAGPEPGPEPAPPPAVSRTGPPPHDWWQLSPYTEGWRGIGAERAYSELLSKLQPKDTVIVGVIDSGVDINHPDLDDVVWTNPGEIAGNGKDDDGDGYVDDVHGWDFIGGPKGDIDQERLELTRLYAADSVLFEGVNADTLSTARRAEYDRYRGYRKELQSKRAEIQQQLAQTQMVSAAFDRASMLLRQATGSDSLTMQNVQAVNPTAPDVAQAKVIWLELTRQGATKDVIQAAVDDLETQLRYGLNPAFNPRPIVGDDPDDVNQRFYGNNDVIGPDALHGTHVAGIIGAERNNGFGIDGVAAPVRIMSIRTVPDGDERDKDVANAIRYAVDHGAKVVNMSFGKAYSPQKGAVDDAVRYAADHGVLLIHAAGNDAANLDESNNYPTRRYLDGGTAPNWIEVGASTYRGDTLVASFSNYSHTMVDVFAPGEAIYSTVPGGKYENLQGTSMAAPVVTGEAALLMAYFPKLTPRQVKQIILDSATRYPGLQVEQPGESGAMVPFSQLSISGGIVNVYRAVQMAEQMTGRH